MEPSSAIVTAGGSAPPRSPRESSGIFMSGRPVGTSPMIGASRSHSTPSSVPMSSAATDAGRNLWSRAGQKMHTARVTSPRVSALGSMSAIASGHERSDLRAPPRATSLPRKGSTCTTMMITPTAEVNPDTTAYGV